MGLPTWDRTRMNPINCDDILHEIFLRLPIKSVVRFKCVATKWNELISTPYFRSCYLSSVKYSPLGFFESLKVIRGDKIYYKDMPPLSFLPICEEGEDINSLSFLKDVGYLVGGVSNGFILCGWNPGRYVVCNPLTNQLFCLPKVRTRRYPMPTLGFSCEEADDNGLVRFKVIQATTTSHDVLTETTMFIDIFRSETSNWKQLVFPIATNFIMKPGQICIVIKGVFLWLDIDHNEYDIAAYNPNLSENQLWLLQRPGDPLKVMTTTFGESSDGLLVYATGDTYGFEIWVLRKKLSGYNFSSKIGRDEWVPRHTVNYQSISIEYPMMVRFSEISHDRCYFNKFPHMVAFHPQDSTILYLKFKHKILWYNVDTGKLELVYCHGNNDPNRNDMGLFPYFRAVWPMSLPPSTS
ncbi:unnamed protein product [Ilex paraguariensis]|uniref:F-box domain-containing protein n=1 Tax=Ilex paraguariensis TaxID=185542 RepID=A0ABC8QQ63_9AQUA